jgi:hypothetical protein
VQALHTVDITVEAVCRADRGIAISEVSVYRNPSARNEQVNQAESLNCLPHIRTPLLAGVLLTPQTLVRETFQCQG